MHQEQYVKMRKCTQCGEEKPLTEKYFYKEKTATEGFRTKCKDCTKGRYKNNNPIFNIEEWYKNRTKIFKEKWSFENIKWIYDNYLNINKQELICKFPNSNYKTLTNIIYQWNIKKIEKNNDWSSKDIQFLKDNYPNMPQEKLQEKFFDRTWDAIKNKASKLNIQRNDETLFIINSESHKGYIMPEERKRRISRTRRGVNSGGWRGGLTPLHTYFRSILYEWKMDSLKAYSYKCALTKTNNNDLQIHHANENFSDIIIETLNLLNLPIHKDMLQYSDEERDNINKCFLELNYKYGLGILLNKKLHKLFHTLFGVKIIHLNNLKSLKKDILIKNLIMF